MISNIITFLAGATFAVGFGLAGIVRPETIIGFLDFAGDWSPDIMFVMGGAATVTFIGYRLVFRRKQPLLAPRFGVPTRRDIDGRLVVGAGLFGVGWGVTGFCPGPALASLPTGSLTILVFLVAMVAGMLLYKVYDRLASAVARARQARADAGQQQPASA